MQFLSEYFTIFHLVSNIEGKFFCVIILQDFWRKNWPNFAWERPHDVRDSNVQFLILLQVLPAQQFLDSKKFLYCKKLVQWHNSKPSCFTVWKIQHFSITQILREINFGECKSSKNAIFAILGAVNFVNLVGFSLQKVQNFINIKIQSP